MVIKSVHPVIAPPAGAPRVLIIGAGSRGNAYAAPMYLSGLARIVSVAEPRTTVRQNFVHKYLSSYPDAEAFAASKAAEGTGEFDTFDKWLAAETKRRAEGKAPSINVACVCVMDEMHIEVVKKLAVLGGIHVLCEKPLATTLKDCLEIYGAVSDGWQKHSKKTIFGIGHVLRYAPHNVLLRKLVREDKVIGDIMSVEHTEPVGWWHYDHSYVRGNWRDSSTTAPALLTKSCHDIDFLLWLLSAPAGEDNLEEPFHIPSTIRSTGSLRLHRKARKPRAAGNATNCLKCPIEPECQHSAKNIYVNMHLKQGDLTWPVHIVVPDIEDIYAAHGKDAAEKKLLEALAEDYGPETPPEEVKARQWYGRCVWESDNNVVDDQTVMMEWADDYNPGHAGKTEEVGDLSWRGAKTATFHMVAFTEAVCARRGRIYGSIGEISYDSETITVINFKTGKTTSHFIPAPPDSGHGGGDDALAANFLNAVIATDSGALSADKAQRLHLGVDLEEMVRSHVMVFAAEEARIKGVAVDWQKYWDGTVEEVLGGLGVNGLTKN